MIGLGPRGCLELSYIRISISLMQYSAGFGYDGPSILKEKYNEIPDQSRCIDLCSEKNRQILYQQGLSLSGSRCSLFLDPTPAKENL